MVAIADVLAEILESYGLSTVRNRKVEAASGRLHEFSLVARKRSSEIFIHVDEARREVDGRRLDAFWGSVRDARGEHGIYVAKGGFDEEAARQAAGCGLVLWGPEELERVVGRAILREALPLGRSVQDILSITYLAPTVGSPEPPAEANSGTEGADEAPEPDALDTLELLPPFPEMMYGPEAAADTPPDPPAPAPEFPHPAPAPGLSPAAPAPLDLFFGSAAVREEPAAQERASTPAGATPAAPVSAVAPGAPAASSARTAEPVFHFGLSSSPAAERTPESLAAHGVAAAPVEGQGPLLWDLPGEEPAGAPRDAPMDLGLDVLPIGAETEGRDGPTATPGPALAPHHEDPFSLIASNLAAERHGTPVGRPRGEDHMEVFAPPAAIFVPHGAPTQAFVPSPAPAPAFVGASQVPLQAGRAPALPASPPGPERIVSASGSWIETLSPKRHAPRAPPPALASARRPEYEATVEWAPDEGLLLRPIVTRELAETLGRDRIFAVDSIAIRLYPRHAYTFNVDIIVDGKLGTHRMAGCKLVDATTGTVLHRRSWSEPSTLERLVADVPITAAKVRTAEHKARDAAVTLIAEEASREVTVEDVDHESDFYMVTKRKVRVARQDVAAQYRGLFWHPVWHMEGANGVVEVDGVTGEVTMRATPNRASNVIEL